MLVFDNSDKKLYYHTGSAWVEAGGTAGGGTPVALTAGQNITIDWNTSQLYHFSSER